MAGKTGTAQVVSLSVSSGKGGPWKYRDHGLFIFFAPFDNPRYAGAVVIEHGGGSSAAYPIARDVTTFLFNPQIALEKLYEMEKQWGGTPQQRMAARYASYTKIYGSGAPKAPNEEAAAQRAEERDRAAAQPSAIASEAVGPGAEPSDTAGAASRQTPAPPADTVAPTSPATPAASGARE